IGMIAGLFYGLSFGMGGLGAAVLGQVADMTSINTVYAICSFLPAIGLLTYFLPHERPRPFACHEGARLRSRRGSGLGFRSRTGLQVQA
ncbi:MAG: hypothetical protein ABW026_00410, partial [Microvirga sp.]